MQFQVAFAADAATELSKGPLSYTKKAEITTVGLVGGTSALDQAVLPLQAGDRLT